MTMARSVLRREIAAGGTPAEVLGAVNRTLYADLVRAELFITMFCIRLDPRTGALEYANAGHNPPLLRNGPEVIELDGDGASIGLLEQVDFEPLSATVAPGDTLLLYTDGVIEALGPDAEPFGEARLEALVARPAGTTPAELVENIYAAVGDHAGLAAQQDDITLVALRRSSA